MPTPTSMTSADSRVGAAGRALSASLYSSRRRRSRPRSAAVASSQLSSLRGVRAKQSGDGAHAHARGTWRRRRGCRRCARPAAGPGRPSGAGPRSPAAASVATRRRPRQACCHGSPRPPAASGRRRTGTSASSMVLSPGCGAAELRSSRRSRRACRRRRCAGRACRCRRAARRLRRSSSTPQHTRGAAGLGRPGVAGGVEHRPARRRRSTAAAAARAAAPLTMPLPWSPSPATASIRPSSSSVSAIMLRDRVEHRATSRPTVAAARRTSPPTSVAAAAVSTQPRCRASPAHAAGRDRPLR